MRNSVTSKSIKSCSIYVCFFHDKCKIKFAIKCKIKYSSKYFIINFILKRKMESEKLLTREMVNSPHHRSYVYNLQSKSDTKLKFNS